jgi:predicted HTH transcriptional regulator
MAKPDEYLALEPVVVRKGYLTNADIRQMLEVDRRQATRIADGLVAVGLLRPEGEKRGRRYYPAK